jgi:ABC-2 type transport system permease protein
VSFFVGGAAPYCVSRDLRHGVMPLYLSRPMERSDYVVAKFAALSLAVFGVLAIGETLLMVGALLAELPVGEQITGWLGGLLACALVAVLLSAIALAIAAFTPRRGLGVAVIITALVMLSGIVEMLIEISKQKDLDTLAEYLPMADPFGLVDGIAVGLLGVSSSREHLLPSGVVGVGAYVLAWLVAVGACLWLLVRRYRKAGRA